MNLPDGARLTYIVSAEAYYKSVTDRPEIWVAASAGGGGSHWSVTVEQYRFGKGQPSARVCVFQDAFQAFTQVPEFFAALAASAACTLDDVRAVLDSIGAADETPRHAPGEKTASERLASDVKRVLDRSAGRQTEDIARDILGVLGERED
jgi:hypothetical protein